MGEVRLPSRLHHTAYVSKDLEATRKFYEDVIGLPLVATWCESDMLFGAERTYCHCFFGLGDGGALAFYRRQALTRRASCVAGVNLSLGAA
jgi:catechol 2,3-dioxygenase-like lactoylglutathione lyase family enzyme